MLCTIKLTNYRNKIKTMFDKCITMENSDKLIHFFSTKAIYFNTYIPPAMYVSTNLCLKIVLYSKLPLFDLINDKKIP